MENQIVGSYFKLVGTQLSNGNIFLDANILILLVCVIIIAFVILKVVKYNRDKNNIADETTVGLLSKKVAYLEADMVRAEKRLKILEEKGEGVDALYKSIKELKSIIQGGKKDE